MFVILALERAASKADAIRNKWKNKKKSRMVNSDQEAMIKEEPIAADEVDAVHATPDTSHQVRKYETCTSYFGTFLYSISVNLVYRLFEERTP